MKLIVCFGMAFLICYAARGADTVKPLDVKLGLWETTSTVEHSGTPPIPAEILQRMTPEQRAKIEERAKAQQGPKTTTRKSCVTKETLDKALAFGHDDKACHRTVVSSSSSKLDFKIECEAGGMKSNGTVHVEAVSADHVKGSIAMNMGEGPRAMKLNSTFESKWLGPVCGSTRE